VMAMAERSGMDPREGEELRRRWLEFLTHHSQLRYLNIPGQLRWEDMLFWTALRRGWGRWRPSALMVQEARALLQRRTEFDHTPLRGEITRAQIVAISLPPLEKERLLQLWDDQIIERRNEGRIERINSIGSILPLEPSKQDWNRKGECHSRNCGLIDLRDS
jgi:hypothetical protein